jgi:sugar phosphate permease
MRKTRAAMRYGVLSWLCSAAVICYVQRAALSVPATTIQRELELDEQHMGLVLGAWYAGYAVMQVPSGWLADRWGSRRALALFALAWSLLTALVGMAAGFWSLFLLWMLMGLAQAGVFPCCAKAIGGWFADTERAFASGLLAASMALGGALAPGLTGELLQVFTWQGVLVLYAVPGVLWAVAFYALTPEVPRHTTRVPSTTIDWRRLVTSVPMILLCAQQFLRAAAMVFFLKWFPKYLQVTRGVTQLESGALTMQACLGGMLGGLSGGFVSDWLLRKTGRPRLSRQGIAVVGMTCCAGLAAASFFVRDTHWAMFLISLGAFCGTFGGISGYAVTIQFGGRQVATVFSVMNMCGNIGAALFPPAVGWFVQQTGGWNLVLFLFAGIFVLDAVCWALLNPRGTLFEEAEV